MAKTISKKSSVKDSVAKTLGKPPPGKKNLELYPDIQFNTLEDGDGTAK